MSETETTTETKPETVAPVPVETDTNASEADQTTEQQVEVPKRGRQRGSTVNKQLSALAQEAASILKGFNEKEEVPEGRRATRASLRGSTTPATPPPPAKRERKASSAKNTPTTARRGRKPKKVADDEPLPNDQVDTNHPEDVEMKDVSEDEKPSVPSTEANSDPPKEEKQNGNMSENSNSESTIEKDAEVTSEAKDIPLALSAPEKVEEKAIVDECKLAPKPKADEEPEAKVNGVSEVNYPTFSELNSVKETNKIESAVTGTISEATNSDAKTVSVPTPEKLSSGGAESQPTDTNVTATV